MTLLLRPRTRSVGAFVVDVCVFPTLSKPAHCYHDFRFKMRSHVPACLFFPGIYQDGNMGLVKQVVSALTKRKIMQLTHTYITLPLSGERGIPGYPT